MIMDRDCFIRFLKQNGIDPGIVSFDNSINDGFNIRKNRLNWETFIRERGQEFDSIGYPSESDALQNMLQIILHYYESMQKAGLSVQQINHLERRE